MIFIVPPSHQRENEIRVDQFADNVEEAIYERPLDAIDVLDPFQNFEVDNRTANEYGYDQGEENEETALAALIRITGTDVVESEISQSNADESVGDENDDGDDEDSQLSHNNRPRKRRGVPLTYQEARKRRRIQNQDAQQRETIEQANARRARNALRTANQRRNRTEQARLRDNAANAARNAVAILNETPQETAGRLEVERVRRAEERANETPQETEERLEIERIRRAEERANETPQETQERLDVERVRRAEERANETEQEHADRLEANNERRQVNRDNLNVEQRATINEQRRTRGQPDGQDQPNTRAAYKWANMDDDDYDLALNNVENFTRQCQWCRAYYSRDELNTHREYNRCCMRGIF